MCLYVSYFVFKPQTYYQIVFKGHHARLIILINKWTTLYIMKSQWHGQGIYYRNEAKRLF